MGVSGGLCGFSVEVDVYMEGVMMEERLEEGVGG